MEGKGGKKEKPILNLDPYWDQTTRLQTDMRVPHARPINSGAIIAGQTALHIVQQPTLKVGSLTSTYSGALYVSRLRLA